MHYIISINKFKNFEVNDYLIYLYYQNNTYIKTNIVDFNFNEQIDFL